MRFEPHPYQAEAIRRVVEEEHVGLMLEMGLGKTVIMLSALKELICNRLAVRKALVIAPKKVAEATWQNEAARWDHLRGLRISTVLGTREQRRLALRTPADVYIIGRDNIAGLVGDYLVDWPFDMIVFDESTSFKNPASQRFTAVKKVLSQVRRTVILTGTPMPGGLEDLWSQIYLLDGGERLGKFVSYYRARYFDENPWRHERTPKPGAFEAVKEKISDICVSMSAADYLMLPPRVVHDVPVALDEAARRQYRKLERDMLLSVGGEEITAMNAATLTGKLLQLCSGCVYDADGSVHEIHSAKLEALKELMEGLSGEHALLFYGFRHELPRIAQALLEIPGLRVRELANAKDAADWNEGKIDVLLAHPASCAYGLNLQGGGHHVIWYTLPWALELYQQANARLHRQGQRRPVVIHRLLVENSLDGGVARALEDKADMQRALMEALKARMEART